MARDLTDDQRTMLRSPNLQARLLTTWHMDDGTYRYCDDVYDLSYGVHTWIGANAIAEATDIKSANSGWASESVTITVDGTRLHHSGFSDPAAFFRLILDLPLINRRVDLDLGLSYPQDQDLGMITPLYHGKISAVRLVDPRKEFSASGGAATQSRLEFTLDSLSARYNWVSGRTRSHQDQLNTDPTDMFFSFVQDNVRADSTLYWGKKAPAGTVTSSGALGAGGAAVEAYIKTIS